MAWGITETSMVLVQAGLITLNIKPRILDSAVWETRRSIYERVSHTQCPVYLPNNAYAESIARSLKRRITSAEVRHIAPTDCSRRALEELRLAVKRHMTPHKDDMTRDECTAALMAYKGLRGMARI